MGSREGRAQRVDEINYIRRRARCTTDPVGRAPNRTRSVSRSNGNTGSIRDSAPHR